MPDTSTVLTALRNELITAGLVRRPSVAGTAPPLFIEPEGGPPAPGEREGTEGTGTVAVTVRLSSEGRPAPGRRIDVIDLVYRSDGTAALKAARSLHRQIIIRLVDNAAYGQGYTLDEAGAAPVHAIALSLFGGLSPLAETSGVRTELAKLAIEVLQ